MGKGQSWPVPGESRRGGATVAGIIQAADDPWVVVCLSIAEAVTPVAPSD